jgi:hypothetical protein
MADIACPVCGAVNAPTRTFCWKCASDLHAPAPDPTAPPPPPKVEVPIQPLLIGGGVALAAIALIAVLVVLLGGSPAATSAPSDGASPAPTAGASSGNGASGASGSAAITTAPVTAAPPTKAPPATQAPPATPKITPVPAPAILSFTGPRTVNCSDPSFDGFITLMWEVTDAESTTLSIDGPGIYKSYPGVLGSDRVPFGCGAGGHRYTLSTVGGNGQPAVKTLSITEG